MRYRQWVVIPVLLATVVAGCGTDSPSGPDPVALIDRLLEAPHGAEVETTWLELEGRRAFGGLSEMTMLETRTGAFADLSLVVYASEGLRIYGVVSVPTDPGVYPIVLLNHGGDSGLAPLELDTPLAASAIVAATSFRSEAVHWFGTDYTSEGTPSPWDRDVDDALALLDAVSRLPQADPGRVAATGGSRGGGVTLLAAAREPERFRCAVDIYGPTDLFDPVFRPTVELLANGGSDPRPGMDFLKTQVLEPYLEGALHLAEARSQLIRRSAIYFADRLPPVQVVHGTEDDVVPVSQSDRLVARLQTLGREVEYERVDGMGHVWPIPAESTLRVLAFIGEKL